MKEILVLIFMVLISTQSFSKDCSSYESRDKLLVGSLCEVSYNLEVIDSRFILNNGRDILVDEFPEYHRYLANSRYTRKDCSEELCTTTSIQPIFYDRVENKLKRKDTFYFVKVKK